jgi:hypothetical protein
MTGTQKLIGWALFVLVVVILVISSTPDRGHGEGYQGSYLGRTIDGQQAGASQIKNLDARTATQRF